MNYLTYLLLIVSLPALFTVLLWRKFKRRFLALMISTLIMLPFWVALDYAVYRLGYWHYNQRFMLGTNFNGFPLEEVLFFILVPYATLFIWLAMRPKK